MKTLLLSKNKKLVPYLDGLPCKGGTLTYKSYSELSQQFNCNFGEGLLIEGDEKYIKYNSATLARDGIISGATSTEICKTVDKILEGEYSLPIGIVKMDPRVGYGVMAIKDIPKHTPVSIYSGVIAFNKVLNSMEDDADLIYYTGNFRISPKRRPDGTTFRGIASFMQHLPGDSSLLGEHKDEIATTNVMQDFIIYNGVPITVLVTLREIKAGELIGYSYGDFWRHKDRELPFFFNHQGEILNLNFSKLIVLHSCGYDKSSCTKTPNLAKITSPIIKEEKDTTALLDEKEAIKKEIIAILDKITQACGIEQKCLWTFLTNKTKDGRDYHIIRLGVTSLSPKATHELKAIFNFQLQTMAKTGQQFVYRSATNLTKLKKNIEEAYEQGIANKQEDQPLFAAIYK